MQGSTSQHSTVSEQLQFQSLLDCASASGLWMQHVPHKSTQHNVVLLAVADASHRLQHAMFSQHRHTTGTSVSSVS